MVTPSKRNAPVKPRSVSSLSELLALYDHDFVRAAYWTVLGRDADINGLTHFTGRLRNGAAKIDVLAALRRSEEGQRAALALPWLDRAIGKAGLRSNRWTGWFVRLFSAGERNDPNSARLRAIENNLWRLGSEFPARLEKIESAIDRLQFTVNRHGDGLGQLFVKLSRDGVQNTASPSENVELPLNQEKEKPKGLSPMASKFMRALRSASHKTASAKGASQ